MYRTLLNEGQLICEITYNASTLLVLTPYGEQLLLKTMHLTCKISSPQYCGRELLLYQKNIRGTWTNQGFEMAAEQRRAMFKQLKNLITLLPEFDVIPIDALLDHIEKAIAGFITT